MITALKLLRECASRGWTFKVDGGDSEPDVFDYVGAGPVAAWNAVKETSEAVVYIFDQNGKRLGWAHLMHGGVSPEESLADYTSGGVLGNLCDQMIDLAIAAEA